MWNPRFPPNICKDSLSQDFIGFCSVMGWVVGQAGDSPKNTAVDSKIIPFFGSVGSADWSDCCPFSIDYHMAGYPPVV